MGSKKDAYSYLVTSMLITSPKMASHVASTTPTALIARLQLLALKEYIGSKQHVIVSFTIQMLSKSKQEQNTDRHTRYSTSRSSSKMRNPANEKTVRPQLTSTTRIDKLWRGTQTCHSGI
jgi:hypothetical protein